MRDKTKQAGHVYTFGAVTLKAGKTIVLRTGRGKDTSTTLGPWLIDWEDAGWAPPGADQVYWSVVAQSLRRRPERPPAVVRVLATFDQPGVGEPGDQASHAGLGDPLTGHEFGDSLRAEAIDGIECRQRDRAPTGRPVGPAYPAERVIQRRGRVGDRRVGRLRQCCHV